MFFFFILSLQNKTWFNTLFTCHNKQGQQSEMKRSRMKQKKRAVHTLKHKPITHVWLYSMSVRGSVAVYVIWQAQQSANSEARDLNVASTFGQLLPNESDLSQKILRQINNVFFGKTNGSPCPFMWLFTPDWQSACCSYWSRQCFIWTNQTLLFPQSISSHFLAKPLIRFWRKPKQILVFLWHALCQWYPNSVFGPRWSFLPCPQCTWEDFPHFFRFGPVMGGWETGLHDVVKVFHLACVGVGERVGGIWLKSDEELIEPTHQMQRCAGFLSNIMF